MTTKDKTAAIRVSVALVASLSMCASAQISFSNGSSALVNPNVRSGIAIAVADMNADGLDDIIRLHNARDLEIEFQQPGGMFTRVVGPSDGSAWGMCVSDVDRNGYADVFHGGAYNGLKMVRANGSGTVYTETLLSPPGIFVQGTTFSDINNDGSIDMLICHDDGISSPYRNDGMGGFTYDLGLINCASTIPSDNSGNYGIVWTDYDSDGDMDVYISKCRLGVGNPMDGRRVNLLFENDGMGNYADVADARGLRPYGQSWSADFADVDNDGDLDCFVLNHDINSILYENVANNFTNITPTTGDLATAVGTMGTSALQCRFEDFDNDGWVDLLITGRGGEEWLMRNNGNMTFTRIMNPFPSAPTRLHSLACGDLNNDGFVDVMATFGSGYASPSATNPDQLMLNNGNSNNWIRVCLEGVASNIHGLGARVEAHGAWGQQIREVRAGEGYGINHSFTASFGIGAATAVSSIVVKWPSGTISTLPAPAINTLHKIIEGQGQCMTICGDCDGNGVGPDTLDALIAAQIAVQLVSPSALQVGCCDTNDDLSINVLDAFEMAKAGAGLPSTMTCP